MTLEDTAAVRVQAWFGTRFDELHPLLRQLHLHGGTLRGTVNVTFGHGLGCWAGVLLASQLGIPAAAGRQGFSVTIFHGEAGLHWHRCFDGQPLMQSLFVPVGMLPDGYWVEQTGPVRLALTVDIIDGGWYWRCLKMWLHGIRVPLWLMPKTHAYKRVEEGRYRFCVGISLPLLGTVLSYGGLLDAAVSRIAVTA